MEVVFMSMKPWMPPDGVLRILPPTRPDHVEEANRKSLLLLGRSYGKMAAMGLGGVGLPVTLNGINPSVLAIARRHQELIREYMEESRRRLEVTMATYAGLARQRSIMESRAEGFTKTWAEAYRRVRPAARESWLMSCNVIQRNQIAREMGVQPHTDARMTILAILLKTEEWIKGKEAEMNPVAEVFQNMSFSKSEELLKPFMDKDVLRGEKERSSKDLVMAAWVEAHSGSRANPNHVFRSGMTDFLSVMQWDQVFGVHLARFLYPGRRPMSWEAVYLECLAVWKCLVDDEAIFPAHYSSFFSAHGAEERRVVEGRLRMALVDRWRSSPDLVRTYVRNRFRLWGKGFNHDLQDDIDEIVTCLPDRATQYAALRFIGGYHSPEGVLCLIVEQPRLCRDVVVGVPRDTENLITRSCFGTDKVAREETCRSSCPLFGICEDWEGWIHTFKEYEELSAMVLDIDDQEEEEEEMPKFVDPDQPKQAKETEKPNVVLCGACPYMEPTCESMKQRFKPARHDILGCALARVRGVEPKPRYQDSRCRFEMTPDDLGFGYERVRKRGGDSYSVPTGHVKAEDLAAHIKALKENLAHGKKF